MGLLGTIATFGAGYVVGAKTGAGRVEQISGRIDQLSGRAKQLMPVARGSRPAQTFDLREIRQVMTAAPDAVRRSDALEQAARLMLTSDIGNVIVEEDDGRLAGIVTDRDIVIRAAAQGLDPTTTTVDEIFTADVTTLAPTDSVHDAIALMRARDVRRLPVVESGRAIGIVSLGDISVETDPDSVLADISIASPDR